MKKQFLRYAISFIMFTAIVFVFPQEQTAVKDTNIKSNIHAKTIDADNSDKNRTKSNNKSSSSKTNKIVNHSESVDKKSRYTPIDSTSAKIPILLYHHLQANLDKSSPASVIITPARFEEHLKTLKQYGFNSIDFNQLYDFCTKNTPLPPHPFLITFDDGYLSNYELAYPILKKYNMKAAIFVVTNWADNSPKKFPHFTWKQAREMEKSGLIYIGNHTCSHADCKLLSSKQLTDEVANAQKIIEKQLGKRKIKVFAYPAYSDTASSRQLLKSIGYQIQLTKLSGIVEKGSDLSNVKRLLMLNDYSGKTVINIINWWIKGHQLI